MSAWTKPLIPNSPSTATDISLVRNPQGLAESAEAAAEGAQTAKAARLQLEQSTGQPVVSKLNAKTLGKRLPADKKKSRIGHQ